MEPLRTRLGPVFRFVSAGLAVAGLVAAAGDLTGCAAAEKAAAKDPMKCERDPDCAKKRGRNVDCTTQCADNPECMDRCAQMSNGFR